MTHVVLENCIRCKHTDCVDICPVDCFHEGPNMLVIDPYACIDCKLCIPECPIDAIVIDNDLPANQAHMLEINEHYSQVWPLIVQVKPAMKDADYWDGKADKRQYLDADDG